MPAAYQDAFPLPKPYSFLVARESSRGHYTKRQKSYAKKFGSLV